MKKTAIEIYALLICFSAMICLSINVGLIIYNGVSLLNPSLIISDYKYQKHQNNDSFWDNKSGVNSMQIPNVFSPQQNDKLTPKRPITSELTRQRLASYKGVLNAEKRSAIRDLIFELIIVFVSSILFFIHWRFVLYKKQ